MLQEKRQISVLPAPKGFAPAAEKRWSMSKSVYSVVLSDEVVAAVDRLAYQSGVSRSRMIDHILAEYAGCETPARQMANIFGQIEQMVGLDSQLQLLLTQSSEMLQLKSAVPYKYNPTVKYTVTLTQGGDGLGELKAALRSTSAGLLGDMGRFFVTWAALEEQAFADGSFLTYRIEDGRYLRRLRTIADADAARTGDAIAEYIRLMDAAMKRYFAVLPDQRAARQAAAEELGRSQNPDVWSL